MENIADELGTAQVLAEQSLSAFLGYLPNLAGALAAILFGWIVARILRGTVKRLSVWANRGLDRLFRRGSVSSGRISESAASILGQIVFWIVLFIALAIAARIAGLTTVSAWLDEIVSYAPDLLIGSAIIVAGYVVSVVTGEQVTAMARAARSGQSLVLGRLAQAIVFISALIIGLDQLGVDVTFLVALFAVATGAVFIGFSIAFGLGARDFISDLVSARDISRVLKPGLSVRIGDVQGDLLEITPTRLAIDTSEGRALIPARQASADTILIVAPERADSGSDE